MGIQPVKRNHLKRNKGRAIVVHVRLVRTGNTHKRRAKTTKLGKGKETTLCGSNGCVAQPAVNVFAVRSGIEPNGSEAETFHTMEQL